jgi:molybdate transport system substrate-binding protein
MPKRKNPLDADGTEGIGNDIAEQIYRQGLAVIFRLLRRVSAFVVTVLGLCLLASSPGQAAELRVAVASNFVEVLETLEASFADETGHQLVVTAGSTGKFYAQIRNGAPFDLLLAADQRRPRLLAEEGFGLPESLFTYATGRLALWSPDPMRIKGKGPQALQGNSHRYLAIANPKIAPYGLAAKETLKSLGLWEQEKSRIVQGENVGQVFALLSSGNAELGFVALSHVRSPRNGTRGSHWEVPAELHGPIRQDAVILERAKENPAAWAFCDFLKSAAARDVMARFGYETD